MWFKACVVKASTIYISFWYILIKLALIILVHTYCLNTVHNTIIFVLLHYLHPQPKVWVSLNNVEFGVASVNVGLGKNIMETNVVWLFWSVCTLGVVSMCQKTPGARREKENKRRFKKQHKQGGECKWEKAMSCDSVT